MTSACLLQELIACLPFIWHGPHRELRVEQLFHCCVCVRCRGNVFTEPLPGNDKGIHIQTHALIGGIYEGRHWHELRFYKDRLSHSKVDGGRFTDRQHGHLISLLLFFKIRNSAWHLYICTDQAGRVGRGVVSTDRQQVTGTHRTGSHFVKVLDLHSRGSRFQSRPQNWLFCLWLFMAFLSPSRKILEHCLH
jgi:hypothetical protein